MRSEREVPGVATPAEREAVPVVAGMANVDRADGYERLAQPERRIVGLDDRWGAEVLEDPFGVAVSGVLGADRGQGTNGRAFDLSIDVTS
jgi:hypothetical protein